MEHHETHWVKGIPKAQPRVKATWRGGHVQIYTPHDADEWKYRVKAAFTPKLGWRRILGEVRLCVTFCMPRPGHVKEGPEFPDPRRPDIDNLLKAVMDALTEVEVWTDDSQVTSVRAEKVVCATDGDTGAWITVEW